ncbi:MAG: FUSC family protein [Solirubrobacterales bacterium]
MAHAQPRSRFAAAFERVPARARKRLRAAALPLLQVTGAATVAWIVSHNVLGHPEPFFAPIAAILALSVSIGQRARRAVEMMTGVLIGILVADLVISLLGNGIAQIGFGIGISMTLAVALGGGMMMVNQAGASAAIVVALGASEAGTERIVDAAVGGAIALITSQILFPPKPLRVVLPARREALLALRDGLAELRRMLGEPDGEHIDWALRTTGRIHDKLAKLAAARLLGAEIARTSPARRREIPVVDRFSEVAVVVDLIANATLTLIRDTVRLVDDGEDPPSRLPDAIAEVADGLTALSRDESSGLDPGPGADACRESALAAARTAARFGEGTHDWRVRRTAVDVRTVAVDLLRVTGIERREALAMVSAEWRGVAPGPATGEMPLEPVDPG